MITNKLSYFILFLISISLFSCTQDDSLGPLEFKIIGLKDTSIVRNRTIERKVSVVYLGGDDEEVVFSNGPLPNGTTITYSPDFALPGDSVTQKIVSTLTADTGVFVITVIGTSRNGKKVYTNDFKLSVNPVFNNAPTITLNGNSSITQYLNQVFTDPGFSANDIEDGNITSNVVTSGNVNIDSVGIYTLTYVVADSQGKKDSTSRTVKIVNNLDYMNGQFACLTNNLTSGASYSWITTITASNSVNNKITVSKISDCFPANVEVTYNPTNDSIFMVSQSFTCDRPFDPSSTLHTYEGKGKLILNGTNIKVELFYTDIFVDFITGISKTESVKDTYTN
jgi:hypothetical protein